MVTDIGDEGETTSSAGGNPQYQKTGKWTGTPRKAYTTDLGVAYQGDSRVLLNSDEIQPGSVDLLMMSPPFALTRKKEYDNEKAEDFVKWFLTNFVDGFKRVLSDSGSMVIDIGGSYLPGRPIRSTYHFELVVELAKHFDMCQEFYWYNPAKLPSPAEWVTKKKIRVKDSVNPVYWFAKNAELAKADNNRILRRYSSSMEALLQNGYQYRVRPSGHDISDKFRLRRAGAIPPNLLGFAEQEDPVSLNGLPYEELFPNLLAISNTGSNSRYQRECRRLHIKPHPARFPIGLPAFFIEFLTEPGDLVVDPFAGSNATGEAADLLGRRWLSCDLDQEGSGNYVATSRLRFPSARAEGDFEHIPHGNYHPASKDVMGEAHEGDDRDGPKVPRFETPHLF
jgi:DNA modification methylase